MARRVDLRDQSKPDRDEREMPQGTIRQHERGDVTMPGVKQPADDEAHEGAREVRSRHQGPQGQAKESGPTREAEGTRGNEAGREGTEGTIGTEGQGGQGRSDGQADELVTGNAAEVTQGALATGGAEGAVQARRRAGKPPSGNTPRSGGRGDEIRVTGSDHDQPSQGI